MLDDWFVKLEEVRRKGGFFAALAGISMSADKRL